MPPVSVTFSQNQQQPIACNPGVVHVPFGNSQQVTWNLNAPNGAVFAQTGIWFKNLSPGTLVRVSDTQYQLTDDNTNQSGLPIEYSYGVSIVFNGTTYDFDPQVANDSGTGPGKLFYHPEK